MVYGRGDSMRKVLTLLKIEGKLALRCPDGIIFGVGMPAGILFLIAVIGGNNNAFGSDYTFLQSGFASLLTVGICATAFMGIPLALADYRDKKILKHFFVTPVSPMLMLGVQVMIGMLTSIISASIIAILSIVCFNYQMSGNFIYFIGAYFLVMFSMYSIGMLIASVCKTTRIANLVTTFVYFPMIFLSGATIPYEMFPKTLQKVANVLPLTHGIKLLKQVSLGINGDQFIFSILLLLIFTIVGVVLSIVLFKWD